METRNLFNYRLIPVGTRNYWVIPNMLLIGYIEVPVLNKVGTKYILDLSGRRKRRQPALCAGLGNKRSAIKF